VARVAKAISNHSKKKLQGKNNILFTTFNFAVVMLLHSPEYIYLL